MNAPLQVASNSLPPVDPQPAPLAPQPSPLDHPPFLADVLERVRDMPRALGPLREEILANLVMLAQIPAPTGKEQQRVRFLLDRFLELGLPEAGTDEAGNAVGLLPGKVGRRTIMLVAHLDTIVPANVDHDVTVEAEQIVGPGISDNALGASVVSMVPTCLDQLGLVLDSDLQLLGSVRSLERSNHEGVRFHLDHSTRKPHFGIVVEGVQLGRLNHFSIGTLRGDVVCHVRPHTSRSFGSQSALVVLNHIINRILAIELPTRPFTRITLGKIRAGVSYDVEPDHAELGLEVVSHADDMLRRIEREIGDLVTEMSSRHAVDASVDFFFRRDAGRIPFSHPLVKTVLQVMQQLEIEADQGHSPSELSEFISRGIPAVTLGITHGEKHRKKPDHVRIEPILTGVAQLLGVILAIDRGICDER